MLGHRAPQLGMFTADQQYLELVGAASFYGFLARQGRELFRDEDFAGLYCADNGRNSVAPSLLCLALLLEAHDRVSDAEATRRATLDLSWKAALGLDIEARPFAKSTLQLFRSQLVIHEQAQALFRRSLQFARQTGYLKGRQMKAAAWVIGGENSWSTDQPTLAKLPYQPVPQFNRLWSLAGPGLPGDFRLLDLSGFGNERLTDSDRRDGWMGAGPLYDLRTVPAGTPWVSGIPFRVMNPAANAGRGCVMLADETTPKGLYPETVYEIPVGLRTPGLYFLHTCSVPATRERDLYATRNPGVLGA